MDKEIKQLERAYSFSGTKKVNYAKGNYPDDYSTRIRSLKSSLQETVGQKFRLMEHQIASLIGDPESISDFDSDRKKFDEALPLFGMLRAFYRRWKLDTDEYRLPGDRIDYAFALKNMAYSLAKKRMLLMKEHYSMKKVVDYKDRLAVLGEVSGEVEKLEDWYKKNYLNVDAKNPDWVGVENFEGGSWIPVDFHDSDPGTVPLERFRKVPGEVEIADMQRLFDNFVEFYRQHELVGLDELGVLSDYVKFKDYSANFSLESDDADERMKAGLMEQLLALHRTVRDATGRVKQKKHTEKMLENSFGMFFVPIDEAYRILKQGYISSSNFIHNVYSGTDYDSLVFQVDADIKDGDIGFVFPLTKLLENNLFYLSESKEKKSVGSKYLHIFGQGQDSPLKIDVRTGIFVAPQETLLRYTQGGVIVRERCKDYFTKFFATLTPENCGWFDCARVDNWLSRHCIFYDDETRTEALNMLRNKSFVSVINHFTNKKYDNLALVQSPGTLKATGYYVTHNVEWTKETPDKFNVTLFEWEKEQ